MLRVHCGDAQMHAPPGEEAAAIAGLGVVKIEQEDPDDYPQDLEEDVEYTVEDNDDEIPEDDGEELDPEMSIDPTMFLESEYGV